MTVQYDPDFLAILKTKDVRLRKSFLKRIIIFTHNPNSPILHNHQLKRELSKYRSINITADYRALYEEFHEGNKLVAYFVSIGTHKELYQKRSKEKTPN